VLSIDADAARAAGLPVDDAAQGLVPLDRLGIAKWSFDKFAQRLAIQLLRKSDRNNFIDMHQAGELRGESVPLTAFRLDYDLTATLAGGQRSAGGFFDAALVRGNFALSSTMQLNTSPSSGQGVFTRLDTNFRVQFAKAGITATAGDFISAGGQSQRALRLGGVQIGSDYSLRPDLITIPLPSFTGQVAVPTGIDLIANDRRFKVGEVEPGEFTVRNVPAQLGRGEVAVVTQDALGREVVQSTRFYVSRNLLARNLSEFAVNAGFVRRRYGAGGDGYGPAAASIFYRRGVSSQMTAEATAEWTAGLLNMGARGDLALGGIALATVEARYSRDSASGSSGTLLNLGLESVGGTLSGRIGATFPSAGYRDVAARLGDPLPPRQYVAQLGFDLTNFTKLQLSASRQERRFDPRYPKFEPRVDLVNASFRTRINRRMDLFTSVGYRDGQTRAVTAFAGLSLQLGNGMSSQMSASVGTKSPLAASTSMIRHDIEGQPLGYSVERSFGSASRTGATVAYRAGFGRVEGQAEYTGGTFAARVGARGTLIAAGGAVFARNQTGGTYALVRTGRVGGVAITREDRPAGETGDGGVLLVENSPPQVPINFDVVADKLPHDALARDVKKRVIIPNGSIGLVSLDVIRFVPRQVRLVDAAGRPIPAGSPFTALPSNEPGIVGFDGMAEVNIGAEDEQLVVGSPTSRCVVVLEGIDLAGEQATPLVCEKRIIAQSEQGDAIELAKDAGPKRRSARRGRRKAETLAAR
jgi:outer membrane usher protein